MRWLYCQEFNSTELDHYQNKRQGSEVGATFGESAARSSNQLAGEHRSIFLARETESLPPDRDLNSIICYEVYLSDMLIPFN